MLTAKSNTTNWSVIIPLSCVLFINAMSIGLILPEMGPMFLDPRSTMVAANTEEYMRYYYYSITLTLPMLTMFFGSPIFGDLSDRYGRKKILLIALIGIALSSFISGVGIFFDSIVLLLFGRALVGFVDGSEAIAQAAIIDVSNKDNKVINLSLITVAGTVGFVIGPIMGGYLSSPKVLSWFGFETPFFASGLLAIINALALVFLMPETRASEKNKKINWKQSFQDLAKVVYSKELFWLTMVFFCMEFVWGIFFQSISLLLVESFHYSAETIGIYMTFTGISFTVSLTIILRILLYFFSRTTLLHICAILMAVSGIMFWLCHSEIMVWLAVIPLTIGVGCSYNTMLAMMSDSAPEDKQGGTMGLATAVISLAWLIAAALVGPLTEVSFYLPYAALTLFAVLAVFSLFYYQKVCK